jgi:MacB-like periplasmic core domain
MRRLARAPFFALFVGIAVVVLSHGFWQRQLGGDPAVVGAPIHLNNKAFIVVGVTAADFRDTPNEEEHREDVDAWIPMGLAFEMTGVASATDRSGTSVWALCSARGLRCICRRWCACMPASACFSRRWACR